MMLVCESDDRVQQAFDDLKNPIVLYFTAKWCSSCCAVEEILEPLAASSVRTGRVHVLKVDVEKCPQTTARFLVRSLPTVILFWRDEVQKTVVGAKSDKSVYENLFILEKGTKS